MRSAEIIGAELRLVAPVTLAIILSLALALSRSHVGAFGLNNELGATEWIPSANKYCASRAAQHPEMLFDLFSSIKRYANEDLIGACKVEIRLNQSLFWDFKKEAQKVERFDGSDETSVANYEESHRASTGVYVETLSGATVHIQLQPGSRLANLKERIEQRMGVPRGMQLLGYDDLNLHDCTRVCDRLIKAGSIVYLVIYSEKIKSREDVDRLILSMSADAWKEPISGEQKPDDRVTSDSPLESRVSITEILEDQRNWVYGEPFFIVKNQLFDTAARAAKCDFDHIGMPDLVSASQTRDNHGKPFDPTRVLQALDLMLKIAEGKQPGEISGIRVGARYRSDVPLGSDLNNYAPDAFSDIEISHLFKLCQRVRQQLDHDLRTDEFLPKLDLALQREINAQILAAYRNAIAGVPMVTEISEFDGHHECGICRDNLSSEVAVVLTCKHALHMDFAALWARHAHQRSKVSVDDD